MINYTLIFATMCLSLNTIAQSFAPAAGQPGSTAISKDSSIIVSWATGANLTRGYLNIANPGLGLASFGVAENAIGPADATSTNVVSLGDSGVIILTFDQAIENGSGPDFAVFENGFADNFLELAFVEVSSDGVKYVRFPSISETPTAVQVGTFDFSDCRYLHNLAGKYRAGFGTPFDLEDLVDSLGIDLMHITHVKLIDVVGTIDSQFGSFDSQGTIINDLYPTDFPSGGFDLDAVAVINEASLSLSKQSISINLYPNPTNDIITIETEEAHSINLYTIQGELLEHFTPTKKRTISMKKYASSIVLMQISTDNKTSVHRIQIN